MTNETTAIQPKSIGDDAQFHSLIGKLDIASKNAYTPAGAKHQQGVVGELIALIDNFRAPAAQASATIHAAPEGYISVKKSLLQGVRSMLIDSQWLTAADELSDAIEAATIQEPVMVAEPLGLMSAVDRLQNAARNFNASKFVLGSAEHHAAAHEYQGAQDSLIRIAIAAQLTDSAILAAPIVADPAGVATPFTFHNKIRVVEAYQVGQNNAAPVNCPDWYVEAIAGLDILVRDLDEESTCVDVPHVLLDLMVGETRADVGDWIVRDERGNLSVCEKSVFDKSYERAATVKAVPSEARLAKQVRADEWRAVAAYLESQQGLPPEEMKTVRLCATVVRKVAQSHLFDFAAPLAYKTCGGE